MVEPEFNPGCLAPEHMLFLVTTLDFSLYGLWNSPSTQFLHSFCPPLTETLQFWDTRGNDELLNEGGGFFFVKHGMYHFVLVIISCRIPF